LYLDRCGGLNSRVVGLPLPSSEPRQEKAP
jgi:hypothetical protein